MTEEPKTDVGEVATANAVEAPKTDLGDSARSGWRGAAVGDSAG